MTQGVRLWAGRVVGCLANLILFVALAALGERLMAGHDPSSRHGFAFVSAGLIATTRFEPGAGDLFNAMRAGYEVARDVFTNEDGEARHDWKRAGDDPDLADLTLEEIVLSLDSEASALGTWSAARGAIVSGGFSSNTVGVPTMLGPPEGLEGKPGVPRSFRALLWTACFSTALGAGLLWFGIAALN